MNYSRVFVLSASAISAGTTVLVACSNGATRASLVEEFDAAPMPETPPPGDRDAGVLSADAAPPKSDYNTSDEPVVCTSMPCVTQLVAGANHFCALLSDGRVRCWGLDSQGSLGRGETNGGNNTASPPMSVVGITDATQISASSLGATTCARKGGGRVQCWGENTSGQLGLQVSPALVDYEAHATPADVALTAEIARVDVGLFSVCALGTNGEVYCWGYNAQRQLARPDTGTSGSSACEGPGLADLRKYEITRIVIGRESVFGLTKDRQLVNWGTVSGRDSSMGDTSVPFPFLTLSDVTSVGTSVGYTGRSFSCAIAAGTVYCWGYNSYGELGTGVPGTERLPAFAELLTGDRTFPQQLALAQNRSCVRMTDGTIHCCGDDRLGQLARADAGGTLASVFERATAFEEYAVQVAVSVNTTCALVQGGKVMCWGGNANGELGLGTIDSDAHPTPSTVVFQ